MLSYEDKKKLYNRFGTYESTSTHISISLFVIHKFENYTAWLANQSICNHHNHSRSHFNIEKYDFENFGFGNQ
ncbi:unnamed protein product [Caenorhabditis angaria]|uniref:Uncharacterized protein n=1 Tax=Caenorhabditis angaria TaxID=860376 RepID=A0A9P1IF77_9PELO|nr:unnamed protein product [Caenorhabditis angaria]